MSCPRLSSSTPSPAVPCAPSQALSKQKGVLSLLTTLTTTPLEYDTAGASRLVTLQAGGGAGPVHGSQSGGPARPAPGSRPAQAQVHANQCSKAQGKSDHSTPGCDLRTGLEAPLLAAPSLDRTLVTAQAPTEEEELEMALTMSMVDSQLPLEPAAVDRQPPAEKGPSSTAAVDQLREGADASTTQVVPQRVCMVVRPDDVACWLARMRGEDADLLDLVRRPPRRSRPRQQPAWLQSQTRATLQAAVLRCASQEAAESPGASSSLLLSRSCTPSAWLPPQKRQAAGPSRLCKLCQVLLPPLGYLRCSGCSSLAAVEGVTSWVCRGTASLGLEAQLGGGWDCQCTCQHGVELSQVASNAEARLSCSADFTAVWTVGSRYCL